MIEPTLARTDDADAPQDGADPERVGPREHARGTALSMLVAAIWIVLASQRPTLTFHFAPMIAAGAWPFSLRWGGPLRVASIDAVRGAIGGAVIASVALAVLLVFDWLRGPTFWGSGPAVVEVLPMIAVAALAGYRYARCGTPGR